MPWALYVNYKVLCDEKLLVRTNQTKSSASIYT